MEHLQTIFAMFCVLLATGILLNLSREFLLMSCCGCGC